MIRDTGWTLLGFPVFESDEMPENQIAIGDGIDQSVPVSFSQSEDVYFLAMCLSCGQQFSGRARWLEHIGICQHLIEGAERP